MWNRPYVPRLRTPEMAWQPFAAQLPGRDLGGELRVLSRDVGDGASTCLWRVPAGWSSDGGFRMAGGEQMFVLEGALTKGTESFTAGCYGYRPPGHEHEAMHSATGATVLVMWDSALDRAPAAAGAWPVGDGVRHVDTATMAAVPTPVDGPPTGIVVKILNREPGTGGMTLLITIPPGWTEDRAEHHDCTEESYKVAGDIWIVENGREHILAAGDYFIRPRHIKHGPMKTDGGTTSLIRFSATVENHYGPLPGQN